MQSFCVTKRSKKMNHPNDDNTGATSVLLAVDGGDVAVKN